MTLFVCAQDLDTLHLGLIKDGSFFVLTSFATQPEHYLSKLDFFLHERNLRPDELEAVCVVTGPGSFTASRVSITIANTLHFVHHILLFALTNKDRLAPQELLACRAIGEALAIGQYAHPVYDREPHITVQRNGDK